jgi:hypothetical protein
MADTSCSSNAIQSRPVMITVIGNQQSQLQGTIQPHGPLNVIQDRLVEVITSYITCLYITMISCYNLGCQVLISG